MKDRIFYAMCFGFIFGVLLRSFLFVNLYFTVLISILALVVILFFTLVSKNKWGIVAGIFILTFSFGIFRFHKADIPAPNIFESQVGQKVSFSGEIIDEPDQRESNQKLTIETKIGGKETKILAGVDFGENFK